MRWSILFRSLCICNIIRLLIYSKPSHIQNSRHSRHRESVKDRTRHNLDIFTTNVYASPSIFKTQGTWWAVLYGTLCNTVIFRTRGKFRTLWNICYGQFYSEPCVTLSYLKPWHFQNPGHIRNIVKHLLWNILFKTLCNPDIFRTLVYSQL